MRVALVYPTHWPYVRRGAERCCHDLATYLTERGHQVDILTSKPGGPRERHQDSVRIVYLPQIGHPVVDRLAPILRFYAFGAMCLPWLLHEHYDVAHILAFPYGPAVRVAGWLRGTPYLFHNVLGLPHLPGMFHLRPGLDRQIFQWTLEGAARVAVLNHEAATEMRLGWGVDPLILPAPVDVRVFHPVAERDLRRPRVLFTADLSEPRKGGILLLRAWNVVHRHCPEAVLVLAGPLGHAYGTVAVNWPAVISSVVEESARRQIEVLGPGALESLPRLYSESAVTVLPSIDETFGLVLVESLACGTPVVCSNRGGPDEIVRGANVGATVPLASPQDLYSMTRALELAEAILQAIELASVQETVARCCAHVQQWSLDVVGHQVEAVYTDLVEGARAGRT